MEPTNGVALEQQATIPNDPMPEQRRRLVEHHRVESIPGSRDAAEELEQGLPVGALAGNELDRKIEVTVGPVLSPGHRAEDIGKVDPGKGLQLLGHLLPIVHSGKTFAAHERGS